jgi:NAD(P)H-hydrate epimerase
MYLYDAQEVREADRKAMEDLSVPGCLLMENAARSAVEHILRFYDNPSCIVIACGGGNNGGDGLALARQLLLNDMKPHVLLAAEPDKMTSSTTEQLAVIRQLGTGVEKTKGLTDVKLLELLESADLLVDGLLGTGARGAPRGEIERVISLFNRSRTPVTALDIPSGVNASTGEVPGAAVRALSTVTFLAPKTGLFVMPGRACSGYIETGHIGVPPWKVLPRTSNTTLADVDSLISLLPDRDLFTHKGRRGTVLVFGGSSLYGGAPFLAARGALRAGAGIVVLVIPENAQLANACLLPETIIFRAPSRDGFLAPQAYDRAMEQWGHKVSSVVVGPGIGRSESTRELVRKIWESGTPAACLDADALHCLSDMAETLQRRQDAILTPHEGEAATLAGKRPGEVASHRLSAARNLSKRWGTVLLKGAGSIIDSGNHRFIIGNDHPCLSVPGSGDVLSGVVGAMLASGMNSFDAAVLAAFIHSKTGVILGNEKGIDGVLATEIADGIPRCIKELRDSCRDHLPGGLK